jgi:hypothetical protein
MPIIPAIQEAEIGESQIKPCPGKSTRPSNPLQKNIKKQEELGEGGLAQVVVTYQA